MEPQKDILSKRQIAFLQRVAREEYLRGNFYLTGGTALAGFYLRHRFSEDLDFFSEKEVDVAAITIFLESVRKEFGVTGIDAEESYNRRLYFLRFPDEILKTEFTYFPFPRIDTTQQTGGFPLDSPIDIAANKLFTVYQQSRARDYIDLYCLVEQYGWRMEDLVDKTRAKFDWHIDPLQLGTQFLKAEEARDLPRMIQPLPETAWRSFFVEEAKRLRKDILKDDE